MPNPVDVATLTLAQGQVALSQGAGRSSISVTPHSLPAFCGNYGGGLLPAWIFPETASIMRVVWGGGAGEATSTSPPQTVTNPTTSTQTPGGGLVPVWTAADSDATPSAAWEDWDDNGDLQLVVRNPYAVARYSPSVRSGEDRLRNHL